MMVRNERVMKRAQAEIDSITKKVRLPTLDDRAELPYINCILKEVYRYESLAVNFQSGILADSLFR